ncbi:hypothetical protein D9V29_10695 [Mycetocola manganoxydans]|uniref:Uncharacterized protein n=1 Tax=Mycetocola manganoxydans TaxID=699879 RepID=A0A3L6ZQQ4_9MICO|nr:hypothetical protein [Mycetocola manganoxydans]RLP70250.1 hypothetical protein D9V29_10695 [Mycetocola manganoxydans]GHD49528.1 hypothetical protein GCM10008097_22480 [Mycetocola manganoxydans]
MASSRGIRMLQTHDASGRPAESERRFDIPLARATMAAGVIELAMEFIAPLQPRTTDDTGILSYTDAEGASGWLILELNDAAVAEITARVQAGEEQQAGQLDPLRIQNTASASAAPVGRSPTWMIVLGVLVTVAAASLLSLSVASAIIGDVGGSVRAGLIGILLGASGITLVITGRRRLTRWIFARADSYR